MMWTFLLLLLLSIGLCHSQPSSTNVHGALPTHTCRVILRGTTGPSGTVSLTEFSIYCWRGDAAAGGGAEGSPAYAADGDAGVAVQLGRSLFNHVMNSTVSTATSNLLGVKSDWRTSCRPSTPVRKVMATLPDDYYNIDYEYISSTLELPPIEMSGCSPSDVCDDWGINILDVPHLQLVDSWVSGIPLSGASPLLQCLNCSLLTARNVTLQDLKPHAHQLESSPFGAVRVTGLQSAVLERISCADVMGARGWACILLQPQPNGTIVIRDSSFINNTVMDNGFGAQPSPPPPELPFLLGDTNDDLSLPSSSSSASEVLEVEMLRCSKDGDKHTHANLPGYGAVLILYNLEDKHCNGLDKTTAAGRDATVLVENTIISNNSGGCGAGISLSHMAPPDYEACGVGRHVRLTLSNAMVINNTAAMHGGGLYFLNFVGSTASIAVGNLSFLSFNTAGKSGGGASFFSTHFADVAITDAHVSHNAATTSGGGLHVGSPSTIAALTVGSSNFSHNTAHTRGGAIFMEVMASGRVGSIRVGRASTLDNNHAGSNGGAVFINSSQGDIASLVVEEGSRMFGNSAGKNGGAIYARSSGGIGELWLSGGASLAANRAEDGCGGALYLEAAVQGNISALSFMNATLSGNTASCTTSAPTGGGVCGHGGAIHAVATAGALASINITGQSIFANNTAQGHGGAIHAEAAYGNDSGIYIIGQSMFANNTAQQGHGGAIYVVWEVGGAANTVASQGIFLHGASFIGNTALNGSGGSIYLSKQNGSISTLEISNSSFASNAAGCGGGAMHLELVSYANKGSREGGFLGNVAIKDSSSFFHNWANGTASLCKQSGVDASHGGALSLWVSEIGQQVEITGQSSMVNNSASGDGGAIYVLEEARHAGLLISGDSNVSYNTAGIRGGFMLLLAGEKDDRVVRIRLEAGSVASYNCAGTGGFLYASGHGEQAVQIEVVGSHITHNTAEKSAGAVYLLNGKSLDVSLEDGSDASFNTAKYGQGGAFWLQTQVVGNVGITNGSSVSWNRAKLDGGGIYIVSTSSSGFRNIVVDGASLIQNNEAGDSGGGIFVQSYGGIDIITVANRSRLENNKAGDDGGAMALITGSNSHIRTMSWGGGSTLSNNTATGRGGGLFAKASTVNTSIHGGCQWNDNTAKDDGGALCIDTSNYPTTASSVSVAGGSQLNGNRAANGGAMHIRGYAHVRISGGSTVSDNTADYDGGAAVLTQLPPSFRLESCSISGNTASRGSGGAFLLTTDVPVLPRASTDSNCSPCTLPTMMVGVVNSFLANNTAGATHGGAFYIKPHGTCCGGGKTNISLDINNSRFISNKAALGIGGAIAFLDVSDALLAFDVTSSKFSGNTAGLLTGDFTSSVNYGGAIIIWREPRDKLGNLTSLCYLNATSTSFEANSCNGGSGGAVTLISCSSQFSGCNFTANRATLSGGAVASLHLPRRSATLGLRTATSLPGNPGVSTIAGQSQSMRGRRRRLSHDVPPTQTADGLHAPWEHPDWASVRDSRPASSRRKLWDTYPWEEDSKCYTDGTSANWSVSITECNFHSNYADLEFGGALYLYASSDAGQASIDNSNFTENKAVTQHAGAVFLAAKGDYTRVQLTNSLFDGNTAQAASAGALYVVLGLHACGALVNVSMVGNGAGTSGGGCVLDIRTNGTLVIQNVTAVRNYAISGDGGAVQLQVQRDGSASFTGCGFYENTAAGNGGAVLLDGNCSSYLSLQDTNMTLNQAGLSGGGLYASYAAKEGRTSDGSAFGFAPGAIYETASPCSSDASFKGKQHMSVRLVTFTENNAEQLGGAVFLAPASAVTLSNLTMRNNTACRGGGSLAAENCSSLVLSQSTLHGSRTTGVGGGFYANGCRRILFEYVDVEGNKAGVSGGGLMVSGKPGVGNSSSAGAATGFNSYTSMLLHRVRVFGNAAAGQPLGDVFGSCKVDSTLQMGIGMGGGLFIDGRVVGVLSRSDLKQPNAASFGPAVAMAQRCYPTNNITASPMTGGQIVDSEEMSRWNRAWAELDSLAELQCWMLQLSDTIIPPIVENAPTKDLSIWVEDFLASALHARCEPRYQGGQQYEDEVANPGWMGGIRNAVATRLVDTRKRVLNGAEFPAGQVLPLVRKGSISGAAELAESLSYQRLKQLALQLDDCIDQSASSNLTEAERTEAAKTHPYIGLPATYIGLLLNVEDLNMTTGNVNLQLQTGVSFDLTAQLYDMFQQRVTSDLSPSTITLALRPRPLGGGSYNQTAADGSAPWLDVNIATLDPGINRNLTVPVVNGSATWGAVTAYAWPGSYSLVLNFSASITPFVQVASLEAEIEILPCTVGKTLDLSRNGQMASWTGCKKCALDQYGLWVDNRQRLTEIRLGADEVDTADGGTGNKTLLLKKMNDTVHADGHSLCKPCPTNAICLGGALIVPEQGHWHSAANSTQIHSCPNPAACSSATDDGRRRFPDWLQEMGQQWDQRTKLLHWCQLVWYSSVVPGEAVQAAYFSPDDYDALSPPSQEFIHAAGSNSTVSVLLNNDATQWQQTRAEDDDTFNCLLFGLPSGDSDSYMQLQCLEGYTGNLCASCISGYYVDSDFNCKRCPELARTIALGLISFFSSVILVLFTATTNFAEGFGEQDGRQAAAHALQGQPPAGAAAEDPVELGDVVKVIVLHLQYLIIVTRLSVDYPSVILRCQAVFGAVTGAENYLVYSPSCLKPNNDSGGQALIQWLASILTPCAVAVMSMLLWTLRYAYPLRTLAAEALASGLQSAWAGRLGVRKALAAWRERKSSHHMRSDTQSVCGSEGSAVVSRQLDSSTNNFPLSLPGSKNNELSLESLEGGSGIGLCTIFRDVQVVAFDASDIGGGAEASATAMAGTAPPTSPTRGPYSLDSQPPPALPTAGSAALVVDLDGVEGGFTVRAPEPNDAPNVSAFGANPQQQQLSLYSSRALGATTVLPEDDRLDRLSDPPGILRAGDAYGGGHAAGAPPLLGTARSMYVLADGIRIRDAPTTVLAGGASFGGGGAGGGGGGSLMAVPYYRHPYNELWHRKMPKSLSYRGSAAINDAYNKIRTFAVSTQQSSQATFVQVDKAMSLREQLGVVLMAAVFILYPSWAHAALSTFACYPIDDGKGPFPEGQQATWLFGYWIRDMQMQCYSGTHLSVYVPIGVVAVLVFCVLPPLASFLFVWRVRGRLADNHVRKVYGFLYKRYKPRYIWWETALQLETLILVTVEVLGRGLEVTSQALLLSAVFTVIALINVCFAPLLSRLLVIMEFLSLGTLILTITLSLYFTIDNGLNPAAENALAILIITMNTSLMLFFLYIASRHYWPSAVKKVAPTAQAVMRKLSSIGSTAGNQHRSAEMDGNQARFRWTVFGRLTAWRHKPDSGSDAGQQAASISDADVPGPHSPLERLSDAYSDGLSGCDSVLVGVMAKGLDIARASISLDDRLSSCSTEPARLVYTSSHVCIQLEDANAGGRA